MKLKEVAGSGSYQSHILKDTLFTWNSERDASFPAKVTFRYTLPTHYTRRESGERHRLPPTYEAHLSGMPGFNIEVNYNIVVALTRIRNKSDWWRKSTKRVPILFHLVDKAVLISLFSIQSARAFQVPRVIPTLPIRPFPPQSN